MSASRAVIVTVLMWDALPLQDLLSEAKKSVAAGKLTADDVICVTAPLNTPTGFISGVLASVLTGAKVRAHLRVDVADCAGRRPCSLSGCLVVWLQIVVPNKEFVAADAAQAIKDFRVTALASTTEQAAAIASATGGAKLKSLSA